jgi:hypothetical protein
MAGGYFETNFKSFGQELAELLGGIIKKPEKIGIKPRFCPVLYHCGRKNASIVLKIGTDLAYGVGNVS